MNLSVQTLSGVFVLLIGLGTKQLAIPHEFLQEGFQAGQPLHFDWLQVSGMEHRNLFDVRR